MVRIILRYPSIESYKVLLEDFPLPSLSKLIKEKSRLLYMQKEDGKISEGICLLFDEMYLQKFEEYFGGEQIGSYENGELYKEIVCSLVLW